MASEYDTDSTEGSSNEYEAEHHSDMDMRLEDDVDALDGGDLDCDVDMESDGDDKGEEDEEEEDEEEQDEEEEYEEEDDGKALQTISLGEMVNTSADNIDTMVDIQSILLAEQGQEMREHTPGLPPLVPAPQPQTLEPRPQPRTPETHTLSRLEDLGLVTPQQPRPAVPSLWKAEANGNTADVDVDQQLLGESAGGDSLPAVLLAHVAVPDVPLPEARPEGSVGEEWTSHRVAEEAMVVA